MRFARLALTFAAVLAGSAAFGAPRPAAKSSPPSLTSPPPIMPVSQVRTGMKGYGLSVFHGTRIERFGFTVLGVLPRMYMGQPLILVRLSGGPMTNRGAYLIRGMSGS